MCVCMCVCVPVHMRIVLGQGQRWASGTNRKDVGAVGLRGDTGGYWGIQLSGSERHGVSSAQGLRVTWGRKDVGFWITVRGQVKTQVLKVRA